MNLSAPSSVTVYFIPHTHWDREWYLTQVQFQHRLYDEIVGLLRAMARPRGQRIEKFTLDGQTVILNDLLEWHPELRGPLQKLVQQGRLDLGSWYTMPDLWLPTPEDIDRNLARGLRDRRAWRAPRQNFSYVPDSFGMPAGLSALFRARGFDTLLVGRSQPAELGKDPVDFRWTTPEGTDPVTVITLPNNYINSAFLPEPRDAARLRGWFENIVQAHAHKSVPDLVGAFSGADHIASQPDLPAVIAALRRLYPQHKFVQATLSEYVRAVTARLPADLPVHRGALRGRLEPFELHGTWSSRQDIKREDHLCTHLLTRAEALHRQAAAAGARRSSVTLERAWDWLLQNHAHDSICGCSPDDTAADQLGRYRWIKQAATDCIEEALRFLAGGDAASRTAAIFAPPPGGSVLGIAELALDAPAGCRTRFQSASGELATQVLGTEELKRFDYAFAHEPGRHAQEIRTTVARTRYLVSVPDRKAAKVVRLENYPVQSPARTRPSAPPKVSLAQVLRLIAPLESVRDIGGLYAHVPVGAPALCRPTRRVSRRLEAGALRWSYQVQLAYPPLPLAPHAWAPRPAALQREIVVRLFPHAPVAIVEETWTGRIEHARVRLPLPARGASARLRWDEVARRTASQTIAQLSRMPAATPADRSFFFRSWLEIAQPDGAPLVVFGNGMHEFGLTGREKTPIALTLMRPQGFLGLCSDCVAPGAQFSTPQTFRYALWFGRLSDDDKHRFADEIALPVLAEPAGEYVPDEAAGCGLATVENRVDGLLVPPIPLNWRPVLNHRTGWRRAAGRRPI